MNTENPPTLEEIQAALAAARAAIRRIDELPRTVAAVDFKAGLALGWLHSSMQNANAAIAAVEHNLSKAFEP
jgi:hypothetical protein